MHLREALGYYVYRPTSKTVIHEPTGLEAYTTAFYPVFSNANNHELFSCATPPPPKHTL